MYGPPEDIDGQCNAQLHIGDDYGDNHTTMRCQLSPGHDGPHREEFQRSGTPVVVTWMVDDRLEDCPVCGQTSIETKWPEHCQHCYTRACSPACLERHECDWGSPLDTIPENG